MTTPTNTDVPPNDNRVRPWRRVGALALLGGFAAFWTWALFFASKESVNRIDDRQWAETAEFTCRHALDQLEMLTDLTDVRSAKPELIAQRADKIDQATNIIEAMIDTLSESPVADEKGRQIVPLWIDEYRIYITDRRNYSGSLRASGENLPFYETRSSESIPISERLATFATDNEMPSCAPPRDL